MWCARVTAEAEPVLLARLLQKLVCQGATIHSLRYQLEDISHENAGVPEGLPLLCRGAGVLRPSAHSAINAPLSSKGAASLRPYKEENTPETVESASNHRTRPLATIELIFSSEASRALLLSKQWKTIIPVRSVELRAEEARGS
ncbi:MAG: hypothetical protein JWM35_2512 [Verrucomicrobia bacterium]|nr:hypothetical protein [Verrucomicrobiota bacterium]